ncbi:hypothetical protein [Bosea massiliensis]|uniref:Uncharacterized protein n=1 Tax=Bosea massiliensis TaxID=151419 RepID=A0ABW0P2Q0_9HYPH
MRRQSRNLQGKEDRADELAGQPPRPAIDSIADLRDRKIVLEYIDPDLIGAAELDAIESYFGDLVVQVFDR